MYDVLKLEKFPEDEAGEDRKFLVRVDDVVRRRYQMCHPGQLRVAFGVYRSKREEVEYTTED